MIPWSWIQDRKINFEPGITCRLKCAGCFMREDGISKTKTPIDYYSMGWNRRYNIPFEKYKIIFEVFDDIEFCGNLSDPIYHPDFIDTLKYLKGKNIEIIFRTNGSGKSKEWWTEVFQLCQGEQWRWTFALDGLPKDSHIYRTNQDGEQVWEMMKFGRKQFNADIQWQWIVFNYNQYDIAEGQLLAENYGMKFDYYHSTRWSTPELKALKPIEEHAIQPRETLNDMATMKDMGIDVETYSEDFWDNYSRSSSITIIEKEKLEIDPDCLRKHLTKDIMFNSMGYFIPCCEQDPKVESMEKFGFYQEKFHIDNLHTIEDIKNVFMSDTWQNFYMGLYNDPDNAPRKCQSFCQKRKFTKDPKGFV